MKREFQIRLALLATVMGLTVWGFSSLLFRHAPDVFSDPTEDMSFGWYVPIFSLYVLWIEREKIVKSLGSPCWSGVFATLPFLFLGFLGVRGIQVRLEIVSFIGLLITIPWAFFGRDTAKRMLFPAGFLLFCIPLATFLDVVTVHLRLFGTAMAYAILKGVGAAVVRMGTMISAADGSFGIDVAAPCSGLRSIFALMALTAGYAYFNQPTWLRRSILFACSIPLAILGNVMRILTICLIGTYCSGEFATGFYHDYSGYVVFLVAIVLMVALGEAITRVANRFGVKETCGEASGGEALVPRRNEEEMSSLRCVGSVASPLAFAPAVVVAVLVGATMVFQARTPETVVCAAPVVTLGEIPGFKSERLGVSEAELTVLPADTQIEKRLYRAADGHWFSVSAVIGGKSKNSIHRPELCLPAQGFLMTNPRTRSIGATTWRVITLDGGRERPSLGFAYTFFNQAGYHTASHVSRIFRDVWDRSIHNRIDRWVMVTVNGSRADERGLLDFLEQLKGVTE